MPKPTREEIARIIDPKAWAYVDALHKGSSTPKAEWAMVADSIGKTDAILHLFKGEWRPISEAPKDGTPILACSVHHDELLCEQWSALQHSVREGEA